MSKSKKTGRKKTKEVSMSKSKKTGRKKTKFDEHISVLPYIEAAKRDLNKESVGIEILPGEGGLYTYQVQYVKSGHTLDRSQDPGKKYDDLKARFDLVPDDAEEAKAMVFTHGAARYGDRNWEKGIRFGRIFAAIRRHLNAWKRGNDIDSDFGLSHLAHAACNIDMLLHYALNPEKYKEFDDRKEA